MTTTRTHLRVFHLLHQSAICGEVHHPFSNYSTAWSRLCQRWQTQGTLVKFLIWWHTFLSSDPPSPSPFDRSPALQNSEKTQVTPCVSASVSAHAEVSWSRPTSPFDDTNLWLAASATPKTFDLSVPNGCSSSSTRHIEDNISACPSPTSISSQEAGCHRSQSPVCLDDFGPNGCSSLSTQQLEDHVSACPSPASISSQETEFHRSQSPVCLDDFGPNGLKRSVNHPHAKTFDSIRASPSLDIDLTEDERTTYALGIWYARYNGLWFPSIFPPTYIDLPNIILKDICSKAVDKDTMTFAHFSDLMECPDEIQRTYQRDNFSATTQSSSSSPTPLFSAFSHQESYCRPAFWSSGHEAADSDLDEDLDDDDLVISEAPNDVSWPLLWFSYLS